MNDKVIDIFTRKAVTEGQGTEEVPERCNSLDEAEKLIADLRNDGIPYNRAVLIFVSDEADTPDQLGFRTVTVNCTGWAGLGVVRLADAALVSRVIG